MNPFLPSEIDISCALKKRSGALLYADLIGFTKMSEEFAEKGILGTGELTQIIDKCFESQLSVVRKYGGDIIEFIGDALFIKFKKFESAKKCSQEMAQKIKSFTDIETSAGRFSLSMRIILSKGEWNELILGSLEKCLFFLTGSTLKRIAEYEKKTLKGEIVTVKDTEKIAVIKRKDITARFKIIGKKAFLPEFSVNLTGKDSFGEFRSVACVFLKIFGYDEDNPDFESLNSVVLKIIDAVKRHRGSINDTDNVVISGSKLLVLFGAPVAFGDECERAVEFALETATIASSCRGIKIAASVGAGYVFAGMIGDKKRRKYSVIGDAVNSTSRILDGLALGETAVTEDVFRMTKSKIEYEIMKSVSVKGKKSKLKRYRPRRLREDKDFQRPFVGREEELKKIKEKVTRGRCVVLIQGQPGVGKTRLLEEVSRFAEGKGILVFKTKADENRPAFDLFASVVKEICSIKDGDSDKSKIFKIKKVLREKKASRMISRAGLIADMILGVECNDEKYTKLDPELKKRVLTESILIFLKSLGRRFCLIAEDLQWAGPEDREVIEFLAKSLMIYSGEKDCFILSSREKVFKSPFGRGIDTAVLDLQPFGQRDFEKFVNIILGGKKLEKSVFDILTAKSDKNPFYAEQMLSYLMDKKLIFETAKEWRAGKTYGQEDLPENLFFLVTARIDGLSEKIRESLKVASAIGMEFHAGLLDNVMKAKTETILKPAVQRGLLKRFGRKELEYIFSHALFKDVVYQSIIAEKRRKIHSAIARVLEKSFNVKSRETLSSLARHYDAAGCWQKAYRYRFEAGLKSAGEYLNDEAAQNLERALSIAQDYLKQKEKKVKALEELANLYSKTGKLKKSLEKTIILENLQIDKPVMKSKISRLKASYSKGEAEIRQGILSLEESFEELKGSSKEVIRERIFNSLSKANALRDLFMYEKSLLEVLSAEKMYQRNKTLLNDAGIEVTLYREKANALTVISDFDNAMKMYEKAIEKAEILGDKYAAESVLSNIGFLYHSRSKQKKAMEYYRKAEAIAKEIGDSKGICLSLLNMGCAYNDSYETDRALEKFNEALKVSLEMDFVKSTMFLYINIGNTYNNQRIFKKALQNTEKALIYAEELGDKSAMARIYENLGNIFNKKCDLDSAAEYYVKTLKYLKLSKDQKRAVAVLENLAMNSFEKMEYTKTLNFLRAGLRTSRKFGLSYAELDALVNIRDLFSEAGKTSGAELYDKYADSVQKGCQDEESLASYLLRKANFAINIDPGKLEDSKQLLERAQMIIENENLNNLKTDYHFFSGRIRRITGDFEGSLFHLSEARKRAAKIGEKKGLAKIYFELALLFKDVDGRKASVYMDKMEKEYAKMKNEKRAEFYKKRYYENKSDR
ncbi:AAA family ATPase [candidate division WOR-3 bacterium]|nr:AAA family ATPase [candidate division WOR-3 bacterium]